jgi:single-stranded-DNA-specific exonuclease
VTQGRSPQIVRRDAPPRVVFDLESQGVHPLLARVLAGRGVRDAQEMDDGLAGLLHPSTLVGAAAAAAQLADAIAARQRILVVADYDCDGATACAVALRGLAMLGAAPGSLHYIVPDRRIHGYGLTPAIVDLAMPQAAQWLVTVDNGIASHAGVAHARAQGLKVMVTDHHLPAMVNGQPSLPEADVIVNPNQPDCRFESKALAGVGVMFYVLLALRALLRTRGAFDAATQPRLDALLDLVALGTVADVARLDANNRRLVAQGLKRIREGRMQPGIAALFHASGRDPRRAGVFDLGFGLGPRINAAGRLADMTLGIECLLTDDAGRATALAAELDRINRDRRGVEADMRAQAERLIVPLMPSADAAPAAVCLFDEAFHEGVVGIVAGRVKDSLHRPTFVFARGGDGLLKGSGRSIAGFHLRDALDLMSKRHPLLLQRFGGHAMAAGCTIGAEAFGVFDVALREVATEWLDAPALQRQLRVDGPLPIDGFNLETARVLDAVVWGQGFEHPVFCDEVEVLQQRLVGEKHLKLRVKLQGRVHDAIWFGHDEPIPEHATLAYRLAIDEWNGQPRLQMLVEAMA